MYVSAKDLNQLQKLILYVLRSNGGKPLDEIHLQKIMFQTMKLLGVNPENVDFRPNLYGPYSVRITEEKESLRKYGYLEKDDGHYHIPKVAKDEVGKINAPSPEIGYKIEEVSKYLSNLSHDEILLLIYSDDDRDNNGKFLENSEIYDEIMAKRKNIAIQLYLNKKISRERAADLAGLGLIDFENLLVRRFGKAYVD